MRMIRNFLIAGTMSWVACIGAMAAPKPAAAVTPPAGVSITTREGEMPSWLIPNIGEAAESYYGPDSEHLIAQVKSPLAVKSPRGLITDCP